MSKVTIRSFISIRRTDKETFKVIVCFDDGKIMESQTQTSYDDAVKLEKDMMKDLERIL